MMPASKEKGSGNKTSLDILLVSTRSVSPPPAPISRYLLDSTVLELKNCLNTAVLLDVLQTYCQGCRY